MNFFFFCSEYYVNGCVVVFVVVVAVAVVFLFFIYFLFFLFIYWDLELMPLSARKHRRPDFNRAYSSVRLLILNGLTM